MTLHVRPADWSAGTCKDQITQCQARQASNTRVLHVGKTVVEAYPFRGEAALRLPGPCGLTDVSRFINENESIAQLPGRYNL